MAESVTISNCYIAYIENAAYNLPPDTPSRDTQQSSTKWATGWHILPTMQWRHFLKPRNWFELVHNFEAYTVESTSCTLFNLVPMATQLAIQGNTLFTSFNNCIYGWGYTDDLYETAIHDWWNEELQPNLFYPEGLWTSSTSQTFRRYTFPKYTYRVPLYRVAVDTTLGYNQHPARSTYPLTPGNHYIPSGVLWNPLNRPESLQEYRPGKNSISFNWHPHECDKGKWTNFDQLAYLTPPLIQGPYCGRQRPGTFSISDNCDPEILSSRWQQSTPENDYTIPNLADQPIVPCAWFWKECGQQIVNSNTQALGNNDANPWLKPNLYFNGTEYSLYKYPPMQHFCKLVPLINDNGTNIAFSAQTSVKVTINLKCKKRRSAFYAPTDGPYSWRQLYSHTTQDRLFVPSLIRARTGGARINWQNLADTNATLTDGHSREDAYSRETVANCTGVGGTKRTITYTTAQTAKPQMIVTFSKDAERVVIQPEAPKRKPRSVPVCEGMTISRTCPVTEAMDVQHPFWKDHADTHM
nr:capsid protein [Mute swan feces associated chapparvovirus 5]